MEISIEDVSKRFEDHLSIQENKRIIFSGKFGIGKTFFLKKYFQSLNKRFNTIFISPVNYVVNHNEDIFELIKADILKYLFLNSKIELKKLPEDNTVQKISNYVESKEFIILKFFINTLNKLNPAVETPKKIIDILGQFIEKYKAAISLKQTTNSEDAFEYLSLTNEHIGGIYEHNYITKLINVFLKEIKTGVKENVLIIDDLDRVDPDHIFRILNILSAHNDHFDSDNKFLFDKIILVCDIQNIKHIYTHKYGVNVDFEGYIDKFYTSDFFIFSNNDALSKYVEEYSRVYTSIYEKDFWEVTLKALLNSNVLTLRKLIKHTLDLKYEDECIFEIRKENLDFPLSQLPIVNANARLKISLNDTSIVRFFKLMSYLYGSLQNFCELIDKGGEDFRFDDMPNEKFYNAYCYLLWQLHLVSKQNISLFATIKTSTGGIRYDHGFDKNLMEYTFPKVTYNGKFAEIKTWWDRNNRYSGSGSFFQDLKIELTGYTIDTIDKIKNNPQEFWTLVLHIYESCLRNSYLKRIGILRH
jgi:hypothetical protein